MTTTNYERAIREKWRFQTAKGQLNLEDLWDLPLTSEKGVSLDSIAQAIYQELREAQGARSFVTNVASGTQLLQMKLDLVVSIIETKKTENELNLKAVKNREEKQRILEAIKAIDENTLKGKSREELEQMLAQID